MTAPSAAQRPSMQERLRLLEATTSALIAEVSLDGVLQRVVQISAEVIGARYAAIGVVGPDGKDLESFTAFGIDPSRLADIGPPPRGLGILGLVLREASPLRVDDVATHPAATAFPPHHPPMRTFLGVPLVGSRGVMGSLYLTEKRGGEAFTEEDEDLAILLAAKAAAAVENARHHEESARLLEEVQQLHRARERFFAMVNHELRNAHAAVHGWAEMLVRKRDPATVPRAAFEVLESAQHAVGLINDLLDLSRLDEDRLKPVIKAVEPLSIVGRAVRRVTPAADARRIDFQVIAGPDLPTCETDASRVEQILVNLLGNATKHAPERSTVRVALGEQGGRVVFRVEDEGPGVAESDVEQIFDVYVTKAGEESRGLGLGLPLSRRLARLLGGELHAVPRPGQGGCFVLAVPASSDVKKPSRRIPTGISDSR